MEPNELEALVELIQQQLMLAGVADVRNGMLVRLPRYLDAENMQVLARKLNRGRRMHYEVIHRPSERRVWVRMR